jgi:steroid delta-isomerase-like uncharacterized protein
MTRMTSALAVMILGGIACAGSQQLGALDANKALVRRAHAEVWSKGDLTAAAEIYTPDFAAHWTGRPDTRDLDEFKAFLLDARSRFPDWHETVDQIIAEGDLVVTRFTSRGTFAGSGPDDPAGGLPVTMQEIAIHRIRDGRIAEQWTVADILSMRQQLGTLSTP